MDEVEGTLRLTMLILAFVFGGLWAILGRMFREEIEHGILFFAANACIGIGVSLVTERATHANFLTVQVADWLVVCGLTAFCRGVVKLNHSDRFSSIVWFLPLAAEVGVTAWLSSGGESYLVRALLFNAVAGFIALFGGLNCMRSDATRRGRLLLPIPFLCVGALFVLRGGQVLAEWIHGAAPAGDFRLDFTPYLWGFMVFLVVANMSGTGMVVARLVNRLRGLATNDYLTGCLNRRAIEERLDAHMTNFRRHGVPLSCILFDLDEFKGVNDRYGHEAGDAALVHVASLCRTEIRVAAEIGRYGGEEYILLLPHTSLSAARQVAERMRCKLEASPLQYRHLSIALTASFGVAELSAQDSAEHLLRRTDLAMYLAKQAGRNRVMASTEADDVEPAGVTAVGLLGA